MTEPGALTGALNWYRGIPFSMRQPLGRIKVPTSYIWGGTTSLWPGVGSS